jgi:hypothetical protein
MRRLALLVLVALAGSLALAGCSSGGTPSAHGTSGKAARTATVVDGMHDVQLFDAVDPVLAQMAQDAIGGSLPAATELRNAASALRQFAAQARVLPSPGSSGRALDRLAAASSTLAGQLTTLAAKGSRSSDASALTSALTGFQSAAASARRAAGLPAVVTSTKPQADSGP